MFIGKWSWLMVDCYMYCRIKVVVVILKYVNDLIEYVNRWKKEGNLKKELIK